MTEIKNEIPGITPASIKMDLVRFKNDILKDFRSIQFSLDDKYLKADEFLHERITQFEVKINSLDKKVSELSNLIFTDNNIREKVESLYKFKEVTEDAMFKRRAKFNEFETKIDKDISRINNILTTSVIYPSLIGKSAKFKTFHEFMDYVNQELAKLLIFKEKNVLDLAPYKKKIDQTIDAFKLIMKNYSSRDYIDNLFNLTEEKIKTVHKIYDERLEETRIENSQYALILQKTSEELNKKMDNFQIIINQKLDNQNNAINNYNEITYLKARLNKHNEVIKELLSYHPPSKKKFIYEFEKQNSKIYSGVKQYIKGNINADELSSMKRFTNEKSKTKIIDNSKSSNISSFPSPDNINDFSRKRNSHTLNNTDLLFIHNHTNNNKDYNGTFDAKKNFIRQKSLNDQNKKGSLSKNINEEDIINKISSYDKNENLDLKKEFIRRKTFNANINSFESSKLNSEGVRFLKKNSENLIRNIDIENHIHNKERILNNFNEKNNKNKEIVCLDTNSILLDDTSRKQNVSNNHFIIKEEDENTGSDNSCKNLVFCPKTKKPKIKNIIPKTISEVQINNKNINKLEDNNKNINKLEDNNKKSLINTEDKTLNLNFIEKNKEKLESLNKILNLNISENNDIKIISLKRKIKSNNLDNNKGKLDIFEENNKNDKNNLIINKIGIYNETNSNNIIKDIIQKSPELESKNIEMKTIKDVKLDNPVKISIKNNSSYPKPSKILVSNYNFKKNNIRKYPLTPKSSSFENNLDYKRNKISINSDIKLNYNSISINNASKTYTNFPKIIKDLSANKKYKYNNFVKSKDMDILAKTLSDEKMSNLKVATYIKKPKKILLTNPDNIPPNDPLGKILKNIL